MAESKIVFDLDGTICPIKKPEQLYKDLTPYSEVVEKINLAKEMGFKICVYTSRTMRTYSGNIGEINAKTLPEIINWLNKWNISFDEIITGKPWPGHDGFYVDDRAIRPNELLKYSFSEILELIERSKL